jgi:adenosylcobinamide-phosphate synthase
MTAAEDRWWEDGRRAGVRHVAIGGGVAVGAGWIGCRALGPDAALGAATAIAAGGRSLLAHADAVGSLLAAGDLEGARATLPALVGRDPEGLDEMEISRAVVESVAENLSDAVVGTVLWGLVGGASGVLLHRAVNTLDAMVGHRSERYGNFGWASARLDDVLGWPAARLSAGLVALAAPGRAAQVREAVCRGAGDHPSPNAGVAEAAFAGALGLQLGGTNSYGGRIEVRPPLGGGRPAEPGDIERAVALARRVLALLVVMLLAPGVLAAARTVLRRGGRGRGR